MPIAFWEAVHWLSISTEQYYIAAVVNIYIFWKNEWETFQYLHQSTISVIGSMFIRYKEVQTNEVTKKNVWMNKTQLSYATILYSVIFYISLTLQSFEAPPPPFPSFVI